MGNKLNVVMFFFFFLMLKMNWQQKCIWILDEKGQISRNKIRKKECVSAVNMGVDE